MIKIKIKGNKVKIKAKGERFTTEHEIAFGAAAAINELAKHTKCEYGSIRQNVINKLKRINFTDNDVEVEGADF